MVTYQKRVEEIQDAVINMLSSAPWGPIAYLSGVVFRSYNRTNDKFPCAYVKIVDDQLELQSKSARRYVIRPGFAVTFQMTTTGNATTDEECLVSGVGAIMDKFVSYAGGYYSAADGNFDMLEVENIDYEYTSPGVPTDKIKEARILVRVHKDW